MNSAVDSINESVNNPLNNFSSSQRWNESAGSPRAFENTEWNLLRSIFLCCSCVTGWEERWREWTGGVGWWKIRGTDSFTNSPSKACTLYRSCSVQVILHNWILFLFYTWTCAPNGVLQGQVDDVDSPEVSPEHGDARRPARESELPSYKLHNTLECGALFNYRLAMTNSLSRSKDELERHRLPLCSQDRGFHCWLWW